MTRAFHSLPPLPSFVVEEPGATEVHEFHNAPLRAEGYSRTIAILSRRGDRPVLAITFFTARRATTRYQFRSRNDLESLFRAFEILRDPTFVLGDKECGRVTFGTRGAAMAISARARPGKLPAVVITVVEGSGTHRRETTIYGPDLEALERAAIALLEMTGNDTEK